MWSLHLLNRLPINFFTISSKYHEIKNVTDCWRICLGTCNVMRFLTESAVERIVGFFSGKRIDFISSLAVNVWCKMKHANIFWFNESRGMDHFNLPTTNRWRSSKIMRSISVKLTKPFEVVCHHRRTDGFRRSFTLWAYSVFSCTKFQQATK